MLAGLAIAAGFGRSTSAQTPADAATAKTPVYYQLVLEDCMFQGDPRNVRELILDVEYVGGQWSAVYGVSRNYNMAFHKGAVKDAKITADTISLKIGTEITPDKWIPGGQGDYTITLKRDADGNYSGSHTGTFIGTKVSGKARAKVYAPKTDKNFVPLAPQEHPRLLLRKADLPALREKAKTPFGQAAVAAMERAATPTSLGFLYQLTGDKSYAKRAEAEAELYLSGKKPEGSAFVPMMSAWGRLEHLAMVYDLCYDALSDDFKGRYRAYVSDFVFQVFFAPENIGSNINWHPVSNHSANVYSGFSLAALALFDEPSAPPKEPSAPFLEETLPPAKDFVPQPGVPVVQLESGKSPTEWLQTEPARRLAPTDPREVFYGLENINPTPGTKVSVGDFDLTFDKMPEANRSKAPHGGLNVGNFLVASASAKLKEPLTMATYTVIEVKEPEQYIFTCPVSRSNLAQSALAGKLLTDRQVVKLEKGYYPLMTMVQWRMKWDEIAPMLTVAKPEDIAAWEKKSENIRAAHKTRLEGHAAVLENWKRTAGGDPVFARMLRLTRFVSTLHCEVALGRGGFQAETGHYSIDASFGHAQLWPVYRRVMGYDLTLNHEYLDFLPRKVIGGPQDIAGSTDISNRYFHHLFPTLREEYKPELLTAWHMEHKVKDPALPVEVLTPDPVTAFISYPLDMKPAPIGTKLPRVWQAPDFGYYVMRSDWTDKAVIAQVYLKSQFISGWNGENAGTYRIRALGQDWVTGTTDRYRTREQESVVVFPELELDDGARGHMTHLAIDENTMILSADLSEVYETKGLYWLSRYGNMRFRSASVGRDRKDAELPPASGIASQRSFAFDFSKESGAACLFVVVDKIDGASNKKRTWLFQPPSGKGAVATVATPNERGFTVHPAGTNATLAGTFVHPVAPKVRNEPLTWEFVKTVGTGRGDKVKKTINCLSVDGEDHFFFIGTINDGPQPKVEQTGKGLDAVVTVGRRTIRFDGQKIVLGTTR